MTSKKNAVLYPDKELVEKTRDLGFNLSKTFENGLKQLITRFSNANSKDKRAPLKELHLGRPPQNKRLSYT